MSKELDFNGIGYKAATFEVDATTKAALIASYTDAVTGKVDANGKNLAVKLTGDNKVGFGAATPTAADALFGIMIAYEQDGYATVQYAGFVPSVETTAAVAVGVKTLAVNDAGKVTSVADTASRAEVIKAATTEDKYITIVM